MKRYWNSYSVVIPEFNRVINESATGPDRTGQEEDAPPVSLSAAFVVIIKENEKGVMVLSHMWGEESRETPQRENCKDSSILIYKNYND